MKKILSLVMILVILVSTNSSLVISAYAGNENSAAQSVPNEMPAEAVTVEKIDNVEKNTETLSHEEAKSVHEKMEAYVNTDEARGYSLFSRSAVQPNEEYSEIVYIYNRADLRSIDGHSGGYYEFQNDISISDINWEPIHLHNATINGNGHTVTMKINGTAKAGQYVALFSGSDNYLTDLRLDLDLDLTVNGGMVKPLGDVYAHNCTIIGDMNVYVKTRYYSQDDPSTVRHLFTDAVYGIDSGSSNRYIGNITVSGDYEETNEIKPGSFDVYVLTNCIDSIFEGNIYVEMCPKYLFKSYSGWISQAKLYGITKSRNCHLLGNIYVSADAYAIYDSEECGIVGTLTADLLERLKFGLGYYSYHSVYGIFDSKNSYIEGDINITGDDAYDDGREKHAHIFRGIFNSENCHIIGNITGTKVGVIGILGNHCSIKGDINIFNLYSRVIYYAIDGNYNSLYGNLYCELGKGEDYRCSVTAKRGYNNTITGSFTVKYLVSGITVSVPEGTTPAYICYPCSNGFGHLTHGEGSTYRGDSACEVCYKDVSKMAAFQYEAPPYEMEEYVEPSPVIPTSFSIQVVNAISGLPIEGAEVSADSSTESTDRNGIATFKQDCHIGGLYIQKNGKILHTENDYIAHKGINIIRVTDVHIDTESFDFGNSASETISGAEINIKGKKLPIINQSVEFDLDLFDAVSVAYNPTNNTLEVLMDLQKLHAENALSKEWREKFSTISDAFDQACQGELDMDKIVRYNQAQQREGNAGRLGKKFALDGEITAQGFMKLKMDEEMSLLEGGVLICGSLETHGTLPIPSTPWYLAYGLEGSLAGGIELTMKSSSYNEPKFDIHGKMKLRIEPSIGVGYGFKDFLSVEVGVEGELKTETTFKFNSFPKNFTAELTASVYALVNAIGFEQKGKWNFAETKIYPRTESISLMRIASPDDLQIVQRDYLDGDGIELMSVEDGTIKTGLYPYSAVKLAEFDGGRKLMVWLDDDTERDLYNKTALYYSFYNGSTWSEPTQVHNDGTSDFTFDLKAFGTNAVLVWQNINGELTQEDDTVTTAEKSELYSIEFGIDFYGNAIWSEPIQLTEENTQYEYAPQIMGTHNNISVLWKENAENSVLAEFEGLPENVYKKTLSTGETVTIFEDTCIFEFLSCDGHIAAIADLDKNPGNSGSVLMINGTPVHYSDFLLSNLSYANGYFYFYETGCMMKIGTDNTEASLFMENAHANARAINDTTVIVELADGFGSELYVSYLQGERWIKPVQLTDFGGRIRSWKSSPDASGNISIAAVVADVAAEGDNVSQSVRLVYKGTTPIEDIVLTDVYAENVARGETATVSIGILNNTKNVINSFTAEVRAGDTLLYSDTAAVSALATGERGYAEINVDIPEDFEKQEVTVTVSCNNLEEANRENNSQTDVWGYTDLVAELDGKLIQSSGTAVATITNKGCEASADTVITLKNDKGETIYSHNMGTIAPNESAEALIEIPEAYRTMDADTVRIVYTAKVSGNSEEAAKWNNEASYEFEDKTARIVSLDTTEIILKPGESYVPEVAIFPAVSHAELYMVSADEAVVTVDENGMVTAVGEGISTVSYYTKDAVVPAQLTVIVRDQLGELKIVEEYKEYNWLYLTVDTTEALFPGETANMFVALYDAPGKLRSVEPYYDVKYSKQIEIGVECFDGMILKLFLWSPTREMTPVATSLRYFQKKISGDYEYYEENGYAHITKYLGSNSSVVLYLPSSLRGAEVIAVEDNAFADAELGGCVVDIPFGIQTIGDKAFYNTDIIGVSIPETVTEIGADAFGKCASLKNFSVNEDNENYSDDSKALYNKDKTTLLRFAVGLGDYSYAVPEGVKTIGAGAFESSGLSEITIPGSVTFIGRNAFSNTNMKIIYCGTEEEWQLVKKSEAGISDNRVSFR